jgi:hypothetical protein
MNIATKAKNKILYTVDPWIPPTCVRKNGQKKALLCYIRNPFRENKNLLHCNIIESIQMADVLFELGYSVDVVDYRYKRKINYNKYDLVIGFGLPFRNSFSSLKKDIKRICYLTGASPNFSNIAEAKRIKEYAKRKGTRISPQREVYWPWVYGAVNAEAIIVTGNEWTASTYSEINENVFTVPVPYIRNSPSFLPDPTNKLGFVWFSGHGALYKGLDIAIEGILSQENGSHLDVCGSIKKETDFLNDYKNELFNNKQISFFGMIDPNGEQMNEIIKRNSFVLLPSCSEGGASSVITCMSNGLIPVVTRQTSVNLEGFGIEIKEDSPEGIRKAIQEAASLTDEEIMRQRKLVCEYVRKYNSAEAYKHKFKAALSEIMRNWE